ncbi:hypothetical protein OAL67_01310 [bacterium]|nr:hypothetical protein [bacterium]
MPKIRNPNAISIPGIIRDLKRNPLFTVLYIGSKDSSLTYFLGSNVFKFLDYLFSKNRKQTYIQLSKLEADYTDPFYLLSMVAWNLRNVASVKFDSPAAKKMSPFVKGKAAKQAESFNEMYWIGLV